MEAGLGERSPCRSLTLSMLEAVVVVLLELLLSVSVLELSVMSSSSCRSEVSVSISCTTCRPRYSVNYTRKLFFHCFFVSLGPVRQIQEHELE